MSNVGFEPTSTNTSDLKSDPLDHSGNLTLFHPPTFYIGYISLNSYLNI